MQCCKEGGEEGDGGGGGVKGGAPTYVRLLFNLRARRGLGLNWYHPRAGTLRASDIGEGGKVLVFSSWVKQAITVTENLKFAIGALLDLPFFDIQRIQSYSNGQRRIDYLIPYIYDI